MAAPSSSVETVTSEGSVRKLTKAEKKALYRKDTPEPHGSRRAVLKDIFVEKDLDEGQKQEMITSTVFRICEIEEEEDGGNPFLAIIRLYGYLPDAKVAKANSLAGIVLQTFQKWTKKVDTSSFPITEEIQMEALEIVTKCHATHLELVSELFNLGDSRFIPSVKTRIEYLMSKNLFKEAMDVASIFHLHDQYDLYDFIVPCVLQDKAECVLEFIEGKPDIQEQFISFLDSFVGLSDDEVKQKLAPYKEKNVLKLQSERFTGKTVEKMVNRILTGLGLQADEVAPRLARVRKEKNLTFQVQCRFNGGTAVLLSDDTYFGNVSESLRRADYQLRRFFLKFLMATKNCDDAVRWVVYFDLQPPCVPPQLERYMRDHPESIRKANESIASMKIKMEDTGRLFLRDKWPILMVDTWEGLKEVIAALSENQYIGLDSEWKPQDLATNDQAAVLQIGLKDAVYLVDFCTLETVLTSDQWRQFLTALLCGDSVKIGFDFLNDVRALFNGQATSEFRNMEAGMKNVLCLKRLVDNILEIDANFIDLSRPVKTDSEDSVSSDNQNAYAAIHFKLSDLSEKVSGIKLDKTEQCSNWAKRPLMARQKVYAAMDAWIVIDIFMKLKEKMEAAGMDCETLVQASLVNAPKKEKEKTKKQKTKVEDMAWHDLVQKLNAVAIGDTSKPRRPYKVKCIVDLMLLGLGKHLRRIGVDVLIPDSKHELVRAAKATSRIILTSGKAYEQLRIQFASRVLCIPNASHMSPMEQVQLVVGQFHIVLEEKDIFSRCMECNTARFVRFPTLVLQALYECHVVCKSPFHDEPFDYIEWLKKLSDADLNSEELDVRCEVDVCRVDGRVTMIIIFNDEGDISLLGNTVTPVSGDRTAIIQIHKVPEQVLSRADTVKFFYICSSCGKVYWDGSHATNYAPIASEIIEGSRSRPTSATPTNGNSPQK